MRLPRSWKSCSLRGRHRHCDGWYSVGAPSITMGCRFLSTKLSPDHILRNCQDIRRCPAQINNPQKLSRCGIIFDYLAYIKMTQTLALPGFTMIEAAEILRISRRKLQELIKRYRYFYRNGNR